jgi:hypothetical protein
MDSRNARARKQNFQSRKNVDRLPTSRIAINRKAK